MVQNILIHIVITKQINTIIIKYKLYLFSLTRVLMIKKPAKDVKKE